MFIVSFLCVQPLDNQTKSVRGDPLRFGLEGARCGYLQKCAVSRVVIEREKISERCAKWRAGACLSCGSFGKYDFRVTSCQMKIAKLTTVLRCAESMISA